MSNGYIAKRAQLSVSYYVLSKPEKIEKTTEDTFTGTVVRNISVEVQRNILIFIV